MWFKKRRERRQGMAVRQSIADKMQVDYYLGWIEHAVRQTKAIEKIAQLLDDRLLESRREAEETDVTQREEILVLKESRAQAYAERDRHLKNLKEVRDERAVLRRKLTRQDGADAKLAADQEATDAKRERIRLRKLDEVARKEKQRR